ncbi:EAL domain-containing protein [Inmirania thermothiophila]|uniref:EAL domain-containing protein n=1 Tax=Inmirania thermothiophila TaxID=1750597 RepID=UPI0011CE8DF0|nr:EAL domain-containing protein [Inmirania thermothiophila]
MRDEQAEDRREADGPAAVPARERRRPGFRTILIAAMAVGIAVLTVVSTVVITERTAETVERTLVSQGVSLAERLAAQSRLALLVGSPENVAEAMSAAMSFPDVLGVAVYDAEGRALLAMGAAGPALPEPPRQAVLARDMRRRWEFAAPVFSGEAEAPSPFGETVAEPVLLGQVVVTVGKASLAATVRDIRLTHFGIATALGAALLLALWVITARVTRPLAHLAETMHRAGAGDLTVRAQMRGPRDVEEMERAFNGMVRALEGRTRELVEARDAAMELARLKGEFVANVSHEIRTPLNGIIGMLELLREMGLDRRQLEHVNVALSSAEALLALINDILDFSRAESGRLELEAVEFDVVREIEEVIALYARQAQKKGLDLASVVGSDTPRLVMGDPARFRQIVMNLVSNAVKFTHRGEVGVYLGVRGKDGDERRLRVEVRDTGIGIPPKARERIFDAFVQADGSTTRRYGGSGLGLAICRDLVQAMGGRIGVESEPGRGSTFWFEVPLREARDGRPARQRPLAGLRVLVADDDGVARTMMQQVLEEDGAECVIAERIETVEAALPGGAGEGGFDILVIDEMVGGRSAAEVLLRLAAASQERRIKVLSIGRGGWRDAAPADLTLDKPLRRASFRDAVRRLAGRAEEVEPAPAPAAQPLPLGARVLVVEDNRANQQVAVGMLERLGCEVDVAANGRDAVEAVTRRRYDLVLMDCQMPVMDGFDATRRIRVLENEVRRIPIVAMTAHAAVDDARRCEEAGMDGVLVKPLRMEALRAVLAQWVQARPAAEAGVQEHGDGADDVLDEEREAELRRELGPAYRRMVEAFLADTPPLVEALAEAIERGDLEGGAGLAHGVKGAAANLGARRLAAIAAEAEAALKASRPEAALAQLEPLRLEYRLVAETLRRADAPRRETEAAAEEPAPASPPRVLVVDDDRGQREMLRRVLGQDGYRVEEAADGAQALAICERQLPDVILLDAVMPVMDGFTACARIRQMPGGSMVPILVVTALDDAQSVERAFAVGATDYVSKPIHLGVLRQRVGRLVEMVRADERVRHLAYHDPLTGLPNRALFVERLGEAIARPRGDSRIAVLFLDLDRFKNVNDTLGHDIGDLLLKAVAERLQGCVRGADLVARLGGDEFTVMLDGLRSRELAAGVARKIGEVLNRPFVFIEREMYVSASIGIAIYPDDGRDVATLIKRADTAMFRAKEAGNAFQFYERGMEDAVSARLNLEGDLRRALETEELLPYFQPIVDAASGEVVAAEALVRWHHPRRGMIPPAEFIELAEETGLVLRLGERMLRLACRAAGAWAAQGRRVRVAVNLSAFQFERDELPRQVEAILAEEEVPAELLAVEITEGTLMRHPEAAMRTVGALREMGLRVAIDDFGTGYSSLAYLKRFPVDVLKVDRVFVRDLVEDDADRALVEGIIELGHRLGMAIAAEGVETERQREVLRAAGCDLLQGFLFARPLPAERFAHEVLGLEPAAERAAGKGRGRRPLVE